MPEASVEQLLVLAARHQNQLLAIRDRTRASISTLWARVVLDPTDQTMDRWLESSVPLLDAAVVAAAGAAISYISTYTAAATGLPPVTSTITAATFAAPRGVPSLEVLRRPVVAMRTALAENRPLVVARDLGGQRAATIGSTDPMLAARAAGSEAMRLESRVVGYRRVPDGGACSFCLLAATQRYRDGDLMPIHPNCGCAVAPIIGSKDPGRVIDRDSLARLKGDGVIDEVSYRRRIGSAEDVAKSYEDKATHWREQARATTDQQAETRYSKRADSWDRKAVERRVQVEGDRRKLKAIQAGRLDRLTAVHEHGELGPTLYPAGTHFDAA